MNSGFTLSPSRRLVLGTLLGLAGATQAATPTPPAAQDGLRPLPFRFRNRFWMSLHHVLTEAAQPRTRMTAWQQPPGWPAPHREAWQQALQTYQQAFGGVDLLDDERFQALRLALLGVADGQAPHLGAAALAPLGGALQRAAQPYREHLWPEHAEANARWIALARPLLDRWGPALRAALEQVLSPPLPASIWVDVVPLTGDFRGAYTDSPPAHTVMPSLRPDYQGLAALEMLFHEASHTGMDDQLRDSINALLAARGLKDERALWHAVQFHSVGELTRRVLAANGLTYIPYAEVRQVFTRGWQFALAPLHEHWRPVLDGQRGRDEALAALVAACYPG